MQYKSSPFANTKVTDLSIDLITNASLGQRGQLDMINIGYTLAPFDKGTIQTYGLELQDAYVRLDRDLSRLFETIAHREARVMTCSKKEVFQPHLPVRLPKGRCRTYSALR